MPDEPDPLTNVDRLLNNLGDDSLAALLVRVHHTPNAGGPIESMWAVLRERLEKVRENLDGSKA